MGTQLVQAMATMFATGNVHAGLVYMDKVRTGERGLITCPVSASPTEYAPEPAGRQPASVTPPGGPPPSPKVAQAQTHALLTDPGQTRSPRFMRWAAARARASAADAPY